MTKSTSFVDNTHFSSFEIKFIGMETLLVRPENSEQLKAVKAILKVLNVDFTSKKDKKYNPEFVKKIQESRKQVKDGKISKLDTKSLWKYI